jgi:hypothetical protein
MNRLTLKALLLSIITELKFSQPLSPNAKISKNEFKKLVGLKSTASNKQVLNAISFIYRDNKLEDEFWATIDKFNASKFLD